MRYEKPLFAAHKFTSFNAFLADELSAVEEELPGFHDDDNTGSGPGSEVIQQIFENIFDIT